MAEKSYTFVEETDSDNGYNFLSGLLRIGEKDAKSVKDMVDQIVADLRRGDCIRELTIIGHGAPGYISIGNGQNGTDVNKGINGRNEAQWGPQLDRIRCRFCRGGVVYLRGCNVGAEAAGARKLFRIARRLRCAIVQAPTGVCNPLFTTGEDQTVRPGARRAPRAKPNPDKGKKKKKGVGERTVLSAGPSVDRLVHFEPKQIVTARYLPRVLGRPFSLRGLSGNSAVTLPRALTRELARGLEEAAPQWLPAHGFSVDGYLQLKVRLGRKTEWVAAGALLGGQAYYSSLREDTTMTYVLPRGLSRRLARFHRMAAAGEPLG